jgi:hypothetical protein
MYPNATNGAFNRYKTQENKWKVEIRGYEYMNKTVETEYKAFAIVDSFSRGI